MHLETFVLKESRMFLTYFIYQIYGLGKKSYILKKKICRWFRTLSHYFRNLRQGTLYFLYFFPTDQQIHSPLTSKFSVPMTYLVPCSRIQQTKAKNICCSHSRKPDCWEAAFMIMNLFGNTCIISCLMHLTHCSVMCQFQWLIVDVNRHL